MQEQVNMLYQRDIARMAGEGKDTSGMEDEYKTFLAELGGKDPRDLGGSGQFSHCAPSKALLNVCHYMFCHYAEHGLHICHTACCGFA